MTGQTSLEDFIKNYIDSQIISNEKESYESYTKKNGIDSRAIYDMGLIEAETDYKKSRAEYGALAENLASNGLTGGGYSDYLTGKAYSEMQKKKGELLRDYTENERKNRTSYEGYLSGLKKQENDAMKDYLDFLVTLEKQNGSGYTKAIKEISSGGIVDYESAYALALRSGLNEDDAKSAAEIGVRVSKDKRNKEIIKTVIAKEMIRGEAFYYALSLGLSEEEAVEIADHAENINDSVYTSDFSGVLNGYK